MPAIYKISSIRKPDRFYIGSAVDPEKRFMRHLNELRKNKHCNSFLQAHYNSWSENDLLFSIVEDCEVSQLIEREQFWMDLLKPIMNLCKVAGSRIGLPLTFASREKIKKSWKHRKPISMESRLKKTKQ
jgi:group I intron endonuclease